MKMRLIKSNFELISLVAPGVSGKTIIDVGCGTGDLVRDLAKAGAVVTGIDTAERLAGINEYSPGKTEKYLEEQGAKLPFPGNLADIIVYFASFHHIPEELIPGVMGEVRRVLKPGGSAIIAEPVSIRGAYFELVRLREDERKIQKKAYEEIKKAPHLGFKPISEDYFYMNRSFADYVRCMNIFVNDEAQRNQCIEAAEKKVRRKSYREKKAFNRIRYKSIIRVNVLQKS